MGYAAVITEVATGRSVRQEYPNPWEDSVFYSWTEGNFSCDCNRRLEFWRGLGWSEDRVWAEDDALEAAGVETCGESAFRVVVELPDGTKVDCNKLHEVAP